MEGNKEKKLCQSCKQQEATEEMRLTSTRSWWMCKACFNKEERKYGKELEAEE